MILKENNIEIKKDRVLNAYNQASDEQKLLLENMFGKEIFQPKDIRKLVKTFNDAVDILGKDNQSVIDYYAVAYETYTNPKDIIAFAKLRVIAEALNEGWKHTFNKGEYRYFPWFNLYTKEQYLKLDDEKKKDCVLRSGFSSYFGFVSCYANFYTSSSGVVFGSRLAFKTRELAEYCGKQFIDIWADYLFA